jgi:hypothetical protein
MVEDTLNGLKDLLKDLKKGKILFGISVPKNNLYPNSL